MALKNLTKIEIVYQEKTSWRVVDDEGDYVAAFDIFCRNLIRKCLALATRKRYGEVVARFIDYLIEIKAFGQPLSSFQINEAIYGYLLLLQFGCDIPGCAKDASKQISKLSDAKIHGYNKNDNNGLDLTWLKLAATALKAKPIAPKSFDNTLAAINLFLELSESIAREDVERARLSNLELPTEYIPLIDAISGSAALSYGEKKQMRANSMLAHVIASHGDKVKRPARLGIKGLKKQEVDLDFPLDKLKALVDSTKSLRDKSLWLLLAGSGIRMSEALNLRWSDVDFKMEKVWINDPNKRRFGDQMSPDEKVRFKGRTISETYIIGLFRHELFEALKQYKLNEASRLGSNDHVFQFLKGGKRGKPYRASSDAQRSNSFKRALQKSGILAPKGQEYTPHSLRHAFGIYMLNDCPIPGGFGLRLEEVQMLMGHELVRTTMQYARRNKHILMASLESADKKLLENGHEGLRSCSELISEQAKKHKNISTESIIK